MTQLPEAFDPNSVAPAQGGSAQLPVSDSNGHPVVIIDSDIKQTSGGDGHYLELILEVIDGPNKGATGAHRLNIANKDATAVRIAYSELSAICHCVGWTSALSDVSVLYQKPFRVVVDYQKGEEAREKGYTTVRAIRDINGNKPGHSGQGGAAAQAPGAPSPAPAPPAPTAPPPAPTPQQQPQQGGFPPPQPQQQAPMAQQPQQQPYQQPPQQQPQYQQPQQPPNPAAAPWAQPPQG